MFLPCSRPSATLVFSPTSFLLFLLPFPLSISSFLSTFLPASFMENKHPRARKLTMTTQPSLPRREKDPSEKMMLRVSRAGENRMEDISYRCALVMDRLRSVIPHDPLQPFRRQWNRCANICRFPNPTCLFSLPPLFGRMNTYPVPVSSCRTTAILSSE